MSYVKVVPAVPDQPVHRIWIDDERPVPEGYPYYDVHCKNFSEFREAMLLIKERGEKVDAVSFDYVLNNDPNWAWDRNGKHCVEIFFYFEEQIDPEVEADYHSSDVNYNIEMRKHFDMLFEMHFGEAKK